MANSLMENADAPGELPHRQEKVSAGKECHPPTKGKGDASGSRPLLALPTLVTWQAGSLPHGLVNNRLDRPLSVIPSS
jgi:hypothetical protein